MFAQYFEYYAIILRGAVFLWTQCICTVCLSVSSSYPDYPGIRSIMQDTKFTVFHSVRLWISQPGLYRSALNFAWRFGRISDRFSPILWESPRDGRVLGVNRGHMAGYSSCWSTCIFFNLLGVTYGMQIINGSDEGTDQPIHNSFLLKWSVLLVSSKCGLPETLTVFLFHVFKNIFTFSNGMISIVSSKYNQQESTTTTTKATMICECVLVKSWTIGTGSSILRHTTMNDQQQM